MNVFKEHRAFFIFYFTFIALSGYTLVVYSKSSIHLYLNQYHTEYWDQFFRYVTHLGDGWFLVLLGLVFLLFKSKISGIFILLTGLIGGILSQGMKHYVFGNTPRPLKYFSEVDPHIIHYVEGVDMNFVNSLPSGHTTAAFGMGMALAMIFGKRKLDITFAILAILVSYSRIYLSQHFLEDVFLGSIIGVFSAILAQSILYNPKKDWEQKLSTPLFKRN